MEVDQVIAKTADLSNDSNGLLTRLQEDCKLRGMVSASDYVNRSKEFCGFVESRGKTPLNADKDDIKAFLAHLKERNIKFKTISRTFSCISAFYSFLIEEELMENNPILPFRKRYLKNTKMIMIRRSES
jgi:site-specific recombinase XerD